MYNIHEHNHTEWTDERLSQRLQELTEINQPWQGSAERLKTIRTQMALITFEQMQLYAERHPWNGESNE